MKRLKSARMSTNVPVRKFVQMVIASTFSEASNANVEGILYWTVQDDFAWVQIPDI